MLKGYDMSKWQTNTQFNSYLENTDFIIHKATEGKTYTDPFFKERAKVLKDTPTMLYGFYHFARPDNNTPQEEVNNFYNVIKDYLTDRCIIVLDWEGKALQYSFDWALTFCKEIEKLCNRPCIIYASASVVKKYASRYKYWWTAHYNNVCQNGCTHDGVEELMVQFTSSPIDTDIFKGNELDWYKLCGKTEVAKNDKILYEWKEGNKTFLLIERG